MILRVFFGLLVMALGFLLVWKTYILQDFLGQNAWAERKFGPGGTNTFYKLVGVLIAFLGILIATNIISETLNSIISFFVPL